VKVDRDRLLKSAKSYATRALRAFTDEDHEAALTDAAVSMEHLSKAVLCDLHPALLIELRNGPLDSLLHLVGHGDKAKKPAQGLRTISGPGAITRVKEILPHIKVPQDRIDQLIALRNGVLHAAHFEGAETQAILAAYIRLSNRLFEELKVDEADRWGGHKQLVDDLVSETLSEVERNVRTRMAKAKRTYDELMTKIPEAQREALLYELQDVARAKAMRSAPKDWDWDFWPCPACSHGRGSLLGETDLVYPVGAPSSDHSAVLLLPQSFICGVCDLRLHDLDELDAVGLPGVFQLYENPPDPEDQFHDNGPWTID
jgi:hypothetical protein